MKGLPEKMGLPEKQQSEHLASDAELSALLETLDALERQATAGEWALIPQSNGAGPMLAHPYATGKQMNPTGLRLIAHMLQRGDSLAQDKANAGLIVALRNGYPLLRERLSAALEEVERLGGDYRQLEDEARRSGPDGYDPIFCIRILRGRALAAEEKLSAALLDNQRVRKEREELSGLLHRVAHLPLDSMSFKVALSEARDYLRSLPDAPVTTKDGEALRQGDSGTSQQSSSDAPEARSTEK